MLTFAQRYIYKPVLPLQTHLTSTLNHWSPSEAPVTSVCDFQCNDDISSPALLSKVRQRFDQAWIWRRLECLSCVACCDHYSHGHIPSVIPQCLKILLSLCFYSQFPEFFLLHSYEPTQVQSSYSLSKPFTWARIFGKHFITQQASPVIKQRIFIFYDYKGSLDLRYNGLHIFLVGEKITRGFLFIVIKY